MEQEFNILGIDYVGDPDKRYPLSDEHIANLIYRCKEEFSTDLSIAGYKFARLVEEAHQIK
jgi:hypothetical protein